MTSAALAAMMGMMSQDALAQLLKGTVSLGEEPEFAINYMPEGNLFLAQLQDIKIEDDGSYAFDMNMPEHDVDVQVMVNDKVFGAHLEKGKTAVLNIVKKDDDHYDLTFAGDNARLSEVVSKMFETYDLFTYASSEDDGVSAQSMLDKFEADHREAVKVLKLLKDKKQKDYYTRLFDAEYRGVKCRLMEDVASSKGVEPSSLPGYNEMIAVTDPNSDIDYLASTSILWLGSKQKEKGEFGGDMWPAMKEMMDLTDQYVTNPRFRKQVAYLVARQFFAYGDHETNKDVFWNAYKKWAKDYPEFIETFQREYDKVILHAEGEALPEFNLTQKDGATVPLSSLYNGKYTYVDVWATWCGPCCKEIPHLEKLVKEMEGNDKVQFVSMSMDASRDAWLKKIEKDQPQWAQYILSEEASKILGDALNITGIPRFFILDKDGKVLQMDAKRPSDPELKALLEGLE